ncbi:MAG: hypothetical protein M1816_008214 [Peltula sp. TS41687]|nr:MAG: hypothetical protein M1816_008214 [Peltula sp. TS41687]
MSAAPCKTLTGWSFIDNPASNNNDTGRAGSSNYKCGHVIPPRTKEQPHSAKAECRVCAWRAVFDGARKIRRDTRVHTDKLWQAIHVLGSIFHELGLQIEVDEDGIVDDELFELTDLQRDRLIQQLFDTKAASAVAIAQLFEDWKIKWGEPTEEEAKWYLH